MSTLSVDTIQSTGSAVTINDSLTVSTDLNVTGVGYLNGNVVLGNASADTIDVKGEIKSHLVPDANNTYDLGSSGNKWAAIHVQTINVTSLTNGSGPVILNGSTGIQMTGSVTTTANVTVGGILESTGNLIVGGNLTVNGATTTVNSTAITVDDPIITLGGDTAPGSDDNKDRGVEFRWHNGSTAKVGFFGFDDSTGLMTFIPDATNTSEVFSGAIGKLDVAGINTDGDIDLDAGANQNVTFKADGTLAMTLDAENKRLGINRAPTTHTLEVEGPAWINAALYMNGNEIILDADNDTTITADTDDQIDFKLGASDKYVMKTGAFEPATDEGADLGSASKRWANLYTGDLHLKNDRGDWTIVEEEDYLSIKNNKNGKTYKFVLEEV